MLTIERQNQILAALQKQQFVRTNELAEELNTSLSTIRRDLKEMEELGLLRRCHGGAQLVSSRIDEEKLSDKTTFQMEAKLKIGVVAAKKIKPRSVIFLDAGSTTLQMIPHLAGKEITVVTNSIIHANQLMQHHIPTYIIGGMIKENTQAIINTTALEQLQQFHFDYAFVGANAIDVQDGFMTPDPEEASIKKVAIQHSGQAYVLTDHTKFDRSSFVTFSALEDAKIITDFCPETLRQEIQEKTQLEELL